MKSKELFNLTQDLIEIMEIAKIEARALQVPKSEKDFRFIDCGGKQYINPKYISFEEQRQIIQFGKFIQMYPNITDEILSMLLIDNRSRFGLLLDVYNTIPNFIEEAKNHKEEKHLPFLYFGLKHTGEKESRLEC